MALLNSINSSISFSNIANVSLASASCTLFADFETRFPKICLADISIECKIEGIFIRITPTIWKVRWRGPVISIKVIIADIQIF